MFKTVIDIGNTNIKIFNKNNKIFLKNTKDLEIIKKINQNVINFKNIVIINVGLEKHLVDLFDFEYKDISNSNLFDDLNAYENLGIDRLTNLILIKEKYNLNKFINIDFGTYTTVDIVENNNYIEGLILLGNSLQINAILNNAKNIKETYQSIKNSKLNSYQTTSNQIFNGLIRQNDNLIQSLNDKYNDFNIIISGNDIDFISIKNSKIIYDNELYMYLIDKTSK